MAHKLNKQVDDILNRYVSGKYPDHLQQVVREWLASGEFEESKDASLRKIFDRIVDYDPYPGEWSYEMLADLYRRAGITPMRKLTQSQAETPATATAAKKNISFYRIALFHRVAVVLIPLMMIVGGALIWMREDLWADATENARMTAAIWTQPTATMVIPDVPDACDGVCLVDGSNILAGQGSEITYAEDFNTGPQRRVKMSGKGYFSVANDGRPFVVETEHLHVNVLGTTFDIHSVKGEELTMVTLYTGSVRIDCIHDGEAHEVFLEPRQRLVYNNRTCEYRIEQVTVTLPDWVSSKLDFHAKPLDEILRTIGWYYGVEVKSHNLDDKNLYSFPLTGREDLRSAMMLLEHITLNFNFSIEGDTVKVWKK